MTKSELIKMVSSYREYHFAEYIRNDIRLDSAIDYLYALNEITIEYISHQLFVIENYADTFGATICKEVANKCKEQINELNRFTNAWRTAE